jgi:hypothetical protein
MADENQIRKAMNSRTKRYIRDVQGLDPDLARMTVIPFDFDVTVAGGFMGALNIEAPKSVGRDTFFHLREIRGWDTFPVAAGAADVNLPVSLLFQISEASARYTMFTDPLRFAVLRSGPLQIPQHISSRVGYPFTPGSDIRVTLSSDVNIGGLTNGAYFGGLMLIGDFVSAKV